MIVSCPNCSTRYVLDAAVLRPPGRHVRCARCQTTWFQEPALDLGAEAIVPETRAPVQDKSRMLPSPPRIGAQAAYREDDAVDGGYRDRQRDLNRDLARDLPREPVRDQGREPIRDTMRDPPQRDVVREALGEDQYNANGPVTREISRDNLRDMSRDLDRRDNDRRDNDRRDNDRRDNDRREPNFDRSRFEPGPQIRKDDIAFDEPVRDKPGTERNRGASERRSSRSSGDRGRGGSSGLLIGGGVLFAMIIGAAWIFDSMHTQIVQAVPSMAPIYDALGYKVNSRGLDFADITYAREIDNGVTVLAIRGQIVNVSDREIPVPKVRVTVRDADKRNIYGWTFTPDTSKLDPKARAPFATRLESPPPDAWDLEIRFAKAGE